MSNEFLKLLQNPYIHTIFNTTIQIWEWNKYNWAAFYYIRHLLITTHQLIRVTEVLAHTYGYSKVETFNIVVKEEHIF